MSGEAEKNGYPDARQLGIIIRMLNAADQKSRDVAARVLRELDPSKVAVLLRDVGMSREALVFFGRHAGGRKDWVESLLSNPSFPEEEKALLSPGTGEGSPGEDPSVNDEEDLTLVQRIGKMRVGEKIKLAMKGDKEARKILVKDTNREVFMAVLNNPGIKESEIEMLAKNTGTNADILRFIGRKREWIANRNIMLSLVLNPKTPLGISIRFLPRLNKNDLEFITKSRALPMTLRTNARRLLLAKAKGR